MVCSMIAAVSVAAVYTFDEEKKAIVSVKDSGGVSPDLSKLEATYAESWLRNILTEMSS